MVASSLSPNRLSFQNDNRSERALANGATDTPIVVGVEYPEEEGDDVRIEVASGVTVGRCWGAHLTCKEPFSPPISCDCVLMDCISRLRVRVISWVRTLEARVYSSGIYAASFTP